jgi:O-Antigen ligase
MEIITAIPGLIALLVCIRRGPERAFVNVYLPSLLLLPSSYHWMITGHLTFNETAIIPIGVFFIAHSWRSWKWSLTDLLLLTYAMLSIIAEYVNKDFYEARNVALGLVCNAILPYVVAKGIPPRKDLYAEIAKCVVLCLTVVAIIDVYEFRMGQNVFDKVLGPLFPGQLSAGWSGRYGYLRTAGPFSHAILAGIMFGIGFRLVRWLKWGGYWRETFALLPISKASLCQFALIVGSVMTLSRGPWIGTGVGAIVVAFGRVRSRKRAITIAVLGVLFIGIPLFQAGKSYMWVERAQATSVMEETAAYRHELIEKYIEIVEEHPIWGWGRNNFPIVSGMFSIDNHYLLLALISGEPVLALFVAILLWVLCRLTIFCASNHGSTYPGSIAITFLGIYIVIIISIITVWLGAQTAQMLFLVSGWTEALILSAPLRWAESIERPAQPTKVKLQRVMA